MFAVGETPGARPREKSDNRESGRRRGRKDRDREEQRRGRKRSGTSRAKGRTIGGGDTVLPNPVFSTITPLSDTGARGIAPRFSEAEGLYAIRNMAGKAEWVWVDCFTRPPIDRDSCGELKKLGYKLRVVSPELEGRPEQIEAYKEYLEREGIVPDAVRAKTYNIGRRTG